MKRILFIITLLTSITVGWYNNVSTTNELKEVEKELVQKVGEVKALSKSLEFSNSSVKQLEERLEKTITYSKSLAQEMRSIEDEYEKLLTKVEEVELEEHDCNVVPPSIVRLLFDSEGESAH